MRHGCALAVLALTISGMVTARDLTGTVQLLSLGQPLRASEAAEAVVYFRPLAAKTLPQPPPEAQMVTRRKQFVPRVVAIQVGQSVRFPNQDPILHNAFSTSIGNEFDSGVYGNGAGAQHVFTKAGLVKVYCNVHHAMFGHILVLDTPWFARPDSVGGFALLGVPDEPGDLVVFHDRAPPWQQRIDAVATNVPVRIELTRRKVPPHMNKFGKPYRSGGRPGY